MDNVRPLIIIYAEDSTTEVECRWQIGSKQVIVLRVDDFMIFLGRESFLKLERAVQLFNIPGTFSEGEALRHSVLAEPSVGVTESMHGTLGAAPLGEQTIWTCTSCKYEYDQLDAPWKEGAQPFCLYCSEAKHDPLGVTPFEKGEDEMERARRLR